MSIGKIYIKKQKSDSVIKDIAELYGVYCVEIPFILYPDPKELPVNDWFDEDGEEIYEPNHGLHLAPYEMSVKFIYKGEKGTANENIGSFLEYITGRDESGVRMMMYCSHTQIGRQNIRVLNINNDAVLERSDDYDLVTFEINFMVGDPKTDVVYVANNQGNYDLQIR